MRSHELLFCSVLWILGYYTTYTILLSFSSIHARCEFIMIALLIEHAWEKNPHIICIKARTLKNIVKFRKLRESLGSLWRLGKIRSKKRQILRDKYSEFHDIRFSLFPDSFSHLILLLLWFLKVSTLLSSLSLTPSHSLPDSLSLQNIQYFLDFHYVFHWQSPAINCKEILRCSHVIGHKSTLLYTLTCSLSLSKQIFSIKWNVRMRYHPII